MSELTDYKYPIDSLEFLLCKMVILIIHLEVPIYHFLHNTSDSIECCISEGSEY